jgi:transposase
MGNPVRVLLTPGQASEYRQAEALIEGFTLEAVLADNGYDSDMAGLIENTTWL